jgi:hypothetical protein
VPPEAEAVLAVDVVLPEVGNNQTHRNTCIILILVKEVVVAVVVLPVEVPRVVRKPLSNPIVTPVSSSLVARRTCWSPRT